MLCYQSKVRLVFVAFFALIFISTSFSLPVCAGGSQYQTFITSVEDPTGITSISLKYENLSANPPRQPVKFAPIIVYIHNDSWDGKLVLIFTNNKGIARINISKYLPPSTKGCYDIKFIYCSYNEFYGGTQCLKNANVSENLLQPQDGQQTVTAYDIINNSAIYDNSLFLNEFDDTGGDIEDVTPDRGQPHWYQKPKPSDVLRISFFYIENMPKKEQPYEYQQPKPSDVLLLSSFSSPESSCTSDRAPTATVSFCVPLILIFALIAAGLFLSGRNPLMGFDFSTPQMKKYHARYAARGRGLSIDTGAVLRIAGAIDQAKRDSAARKEKGYWGMIKSDLKNIFTGGDRGKKKSEKEGGKKEGDLKNVALAQLGLSSGGRRGMAFFGIERGIATVRRAITTVTSIGSIKRETLKEVRKVGGGYITGKQFGFLLGMFLDDLNAYLFGTAAIGGFAKKSWTEVLTGPPSFKKSMETLLKLQPGGKGLECSYTVEVMTPNGPSKETRTAVVKLDKDGNITINGIKVFDVKVDAQGKQHIKLNIEELVKIGLTEKKVQEIMGNYVREVNIALLGVRDSGKEELINVAEKIIKIADKGKENEEKRIETITAQLVAIEKMKNLESEIEKLKSEINVAEGEKKKELLAQLEQKNAEKNELKEKLPPTPIDPEQLKKDLKDAEQRKTWYNTVITAHAKKLFDAEYWNAVFKLQQDDRVNNSLKTLFEEYAGLQTQIELADALYNTGATAYGATKNLKDGLVFVTTFTEGAATLGKAGDVMIRIEKMAEEGKFDKQQINELNAANTVANYFVTRTTAAEALYCAEPTLRIPELRFGIDPYKLQNTLDPEEMLKLEGVTTLYSKLAEIYRNVSPEKVEIKEARDLVITTAHKAVMDDPETTAAFLTAVATSSTRSHFGDLGMIDGYIEDYKKAQNDDEKKSILQSVNTYNEIQRIHDEVQFEMLETLLNQPDGIKRIKKWAKENANEIKMNPELEKAIKELEDGDEEAKKEAKKRFQTIAALKAEDRLIDKLFELKLEDIYKA